ncbi:DUF3861 domain-containing protein [Shewanella sp. 1_MG-2023]|jgi:hypothetical protein|uniref:DUF3861 domain-containing protein n=1 Tax=Shewanella electrodiphila TaxID=934143 RepID=A0ABT0KQX8_9GAMM|nr:MULTISPECIES: DUF3861 domain-containing protein [Shewanella]MCC4833106.1 DUF3861 domain-containing protein [Shewanella sp. 10N.7]MCL1046246.1 DUF3861 domain-containing protein [Shewanella electrodiphila]MDO6613554.1 DUF3861 domain-containing protein [Shewanella sp. 7_MG-2023]MDO6773384.1 DUF3861 domain-containing protein [Shewanella sp. 2_MG-2023]MDO6796035.1 DUF3861 domain-containing protein [Shewanella sp. 1_MG-2023]
MSSIIRKNHQYRITIEEINLPAQQTGQQLDFELQDREDLFNVVKNLQKGSGLETSLATKVAVSLRLLGPIMMENRKHPLFVDFMPHFKAFMHNLKSTVKSAIK